MGALPHHAVSTPESTPLSDRQQETLECPFRDAEALLWSRVCLWSCPDATLAACALQTTCEHRRDAAPCVARCFDDGIEERGKQRCGRNHGLLPPLLLFPHREGRRAVPHGTGSSTHKKTPTWNGRGRHIHTAAPFPRKDVSAPCRAGLLARGISYSLHLPKGIALSGLCRFRSAHSCGAAMGLHHLPWSQSQTVTSPTSGIFNSVGELTVVSSGLSRIFLEESALRKKSILTSASLL